MRLDQYTTLMLIEERRALEKYVHSVHFPRIEEHMQDIIVSYLSLILAEIDKRKSRCVK